MFGYQPDREKRIKQVAGAIIGSAVIGAVSSQNAADTQAAAQQSAIMQQKDALAQQKQLSKPFVDAGTEALKTMQAGLKPGGQYNTPFTAANFQNTPAYQFQMNQGLKQIEQQMAARGQGGSGAQMQALSQFNQGLASETYQQQYNNYMQNQQQQYNNMAGIEQQGQSAAAGQAANIGTTAANVGNLTVAQGTTQAQGQLGMAQALGQGASTYLQNQQYQQMLNSSNASQSQAALNDAFLPTDGSNLNVPGVSSGMLP